MFGPKLRIEYDGVGITLRPFAKKEMERSAELFSSARVSLYLGMRGWSKEDEEEWFEKIRKEEESIIWAIVPDGANGPVGTTGLHYIQDPSGSCISGIAISDTNWWGKGVASRAHLIRTWYAADVLCRNTIQSYVAVSNEASWHALERVGYIRTGKFLRKEFIRGKFTDEYILSWLHPERISLLYPDGLPEDKEIKQGIKRAKKALKKARELVQLL